MKSIRNIQNQQGVMLIEALIAILIFSIGILAIIGLQVASVRMSGDAQYRSQASILANKLIGQMWVYDRTPKSLQDAFGGAPNAASGAQYASWVAEVQSTLPGVVGDALPTVDINPSSGTNVVPTSGVISTSSNVTITLFWKLPSEKPEIPLHKLVATTQIR